MINTTTADMVCTDNAPTIRLTLTNTRLTASIRLGSGIANIQLMRPIVRSSTTLYAFGTLFTTEFLNIVKKGTTIRFMDFPATNGNIQSARSDRPQIADAFTTCAPAPSMPTAIPTDGRPKALPGNAPSLSVGRYVQMGRSTTPSFTNTGLTAGTTCYYKMAALNQSGVTALSAAVSAKVH